MSNSTSFPTVYIDTLALQKLTAYYKYAKGELSGLGVAEVSAEGDVIVSDAFIFEQECSYSETELNPEALSKWITEIIRIGQDPSRFRLWFHVHPIEGWSGVDDKNIEGLNNGEWLLSIVKTPSGLLARLDLYAPFRVTLDQLNIRELRDTNSDLELQIEQEVKQKVKAKVWQGHMIGQQGQMWQPGTGVWVKTKAGEWVQGADDQKKLIAPSTSGTNSPNTPESMAERDKFFEALAESDWENYYEWSEQQRLISR